RHSDRVPVLSMSRPPFGVCRAAGQIEYCSSWLTTTRYWVVSSSSSSAIPTSPVPQILALVLLLVASFGQGCPGTAAFGVWGQRVVSCLKFRVLVGAEWGFRGEMH